MERLDVVVTGTVQGVGFRPFVHRLARRLGLAGWVRNHRGAVEIALEGPPSTLDAFLVALRAEAPPHAHITDVVATEGVPMELADFRVVPSEVARGGDVHITPDAATCVECLAEVHDPADRRHRYAFACCTRCGPRLTIVVAAPWDRSRTSMAPFAMCDACRAEYEEPTDRRFHAEPIACPACGPRLFVEACDGVAPASDPIAEAARRIRDGQIVAIKGIGGFHLAVDATSEAAVARLRERKGRDARPFAVMVRDLDAASRITSISETESALLGGDVRPIVLIRGSPRGVCPSVGRGVADVGLMLPYTPLHHVLMAEVDRPLVMTSGNRSDEPIVHTDVDARARLGAVADAFLLHDREIRVRCDDSVVRVVSGRTLPIRRSRGYAPAEIALPLPLGVPTLATGGHLKATFALGRGEMAIPSHHLGDLDELVSWNAYTDAIRHYEELFQVAPELIVHDAHPDYASTRYAIARAEEHGLRRIAVQHHRAHVASCMAEHGIEGDVIGVAFDGAGWGDDDTVWGGEFFVGSYATLTRVAHLLPVALPGGDVAMREPWRMAVACLLASGLPIDRAGAPTREALRTVAHMIEREVRSPPTSSVGRLFDAVASLCGIRAVSSYEAQAAMELEAAAAAYVGDTSAYSFELVEQRDAPFLIDWRPIIAEMTIDIARDRSRNEVAQKFHETLVAIVVAVCERARESRGLRRVVLTGGVFMNALLLASATGRLRVSGFDVLRHERVPSNDGGLALGQLAIAAARIDRA